MASKIATLLALTLTSAALGTTADAKTVRVIASFSVLADVVRAVGGSNVEVKSLVPPNGDPHDYEPSPDDAKALRAANVTFVSGLGLESWFGRLAKAAGFKGEAISVSAGIVPIDAKEAGKTIVDPHVWNSAANVARWIANIEAALVAADPDDAPAFHANALAYRTHIDELDAYAHARLDVIPATQRKVLTSHDAFGYFAKAYGVTFLAPLGVSTETEASAAGVAKLIDQIKRERVKVYFFENSNDPRLVKQIASATGARPGGALYVESLSRPDGPAPTYVKMFRYNVDKLADAMAQ